MDVATWVNRVYSGKEESLKRPVVWVASLGWIKVNPVRASELMWMYRSLKPLPHATFSLLFLVLPEWDLICPATVSMLEVIWKRRPQTLFISSYWNGGAKRVAFISWLTAWWIPKCLLLCFPNTWKGFTLIRMVHTYDIWDRRQGAQTGASEKCPWGNFRVKILQRS